jgi:hypothetical protein
MKDQIPEPTIGRVVYVYRPQNLDPAKPTVAWVADVGSGFGADSPYTINCAVMANSGDFVLGGWQNVKHVSEPRHADEPYWDWMPFQKGQAAKTEALQKELDEKVLDRKHAPK